MAIGYSFQALVDLVKSHITSNASELANYALKTGTNATGTWPVNITGVSANATKLQNSRSINGTLFNGAGSITTVVWGTARNITIGGTAKSVDGSANISWNLSEIGAAPTTHSHTWSQISDPPATATRWPTYTEVTGTPTLGNSSSRNVGTTPGTVSDGADSRILNGQTAFSWGDFKSLVSVVTTNKNVFM